MMVSVVVEGGVRYASCRLNSFSSMCLFTFPLPYTPLLPSSQSTTSLFCQFKKRRNLSPLAEEPDFPHGSVLGKDSTERGREVSVLMIFFVCGAGLFLLIRKKLIHGGNPRVLTLTPSLLSPLPTTSLSLLSSLAPLLRGRIALCLLACSACCIIAGIFDSEYALVLCIIRKCRCSPAPVVTLSLFVHIILLIHTMRVSVCLLSLLLDAVSLFFFFFLFLIRARNAAAHI